MFLNECISVKQHIHSDKEGKLNILSRSFLFPDCLSLVGLKDEPLGMWWALLEPETSLKLGAGPPDNCIGEVPDFPVCAAGISLCKQIDNTMSTSGAGPEILKESKFHSAAVLVISGHESNIHLHYHQLKLCQCSMMKPSFCIGRILIHYTISRIKEASKF